MAHRIPPSLEVTPSVRIPAHEIDLTFAASGGPGGQNVNKVHSKAVLRWTPGRSSAFSDGDRAWLLHRLEARLTTEGDLVLSSDRFRDQPRNVDAVLDRLVDLVRDGLHRPAARRRTRPTRASRERRLSTKRARGAVKRDRRRAARDE